MQQESCNSIEEWARYEENTIYIDLFCKLLYWVGTGVLDARVWWGQLDAYVSLLMQPELCNSIEEWSRYDKNNISMDILCEVL
jgi:hypothetical protein